MSMKWDAGKAVSTLVKERGITYGELATRVNIHSQTAWGLQKRTSMQVSLLYDLSLALQSNLLKDVALEIEHKLYPDKIAEPLPGYDSVNYKLKYEQASNELDKARELIRVLQDNLKDKQVLIELLTVKKK